MSNQNNICVRQNRDAAQITRCQKAIRQWPRSTDNLANSLSLMGNAVRLKILLLLMEEDRLCVCDLAEILRMTVPAISQHLKKMKEGGLLLVEKEGTTLYQRLSDEAKGLLESLPTGRQALPIVRQA